jgi:hypothetical protein
MASSPRSKPRKPAGGPKKTGSKAAAMKTDGAAGPAAPGKAAVPADAGAELTAAEQAARDEELAATRKQAIRRLLILLCVLAVPLYIWAAVVISAHNK